MPERAPDPTSRRELRALLLSRDFRPRKSLGQTFLTDANIVRKIIAAAEIGPDDPVLEIGPGAGALTRGLAETARRVVAIEIDPVLVEVLQQTLGGRVEVIQQDVLQVDWLALLSKERAGDWKVLANLPYAITGPAILKLLDARDWIDRLVIMVQREVAERLVAPPGSRVRGLLGVLVQAACEATLVWRVPRTCFWPAPNVDSAVVLLTVRRPPLVPPELEAGFRRLVRAAFGARRKMLANSLAQSADLQVTREEAARVLTHCEISLQSRAESLSVEQFLCLTRAYASRGESRQCGA